MSTITGDTGWSFTVDPTVDSGVVDYTYTGPDSGDTFEARVFGQHPDGTIYFASGDLHIGNVAATPQVESQALSSSSDGLYRVVIYDLTTSHAVLTYDVVASWLKVPTPYTAPVRFRQADSLHRWLPWDVYGQVGASVLTKQFAVPHDATTPLRTWGSREDGTGANIPNTIGDFLHQRHTQGVTIVRDSLASAGAQLEGQAVHLPMSRHWAGIGGFLYVPSFPQLTRRETTWPYAL